MNKDINDLRERLFSALDGLADEKKPMEIERARAIADVARVIVDSAKAEIQLLHVTGARGAATQFIPSPATGPNAPRRLPGPTAGKRRAPASAKTAPDAVGCPPRQCQSCMQRTITDPCEFCKKPWKKDFDG